jgi:hypothetical protein
MDRPSRPLRGYKYWALQAGQGAPSGIVIVCAVSSEENEEGGEKLSSNRRIELGGTRWTSPRHPGRIAEDIPGRLSDLGGRISCWGCLSVVRSMRDVGNSTNVPTLGK